MRDKSFEKVDLLGVLATEDEVLREFDKEKMFINSVEEIQFYIKLLSSEPYDFPPLESGTTLFNCFANQLHNVGFHDDKSLSHEERFEKLTTFLENKLIKFNVHQKESTDYNRTYFYNGVNLFPITVSGISEKSITFHPYPIIEKTKINMELDELTEKLINKEDIGLGHLDGISKHADDIPPFLLYKDDTTLYAIGEVSDHQYSDRNGMRYLCDNGLDIYEIRTGDLDDIVFSDNSVAFITARLSQKIEENIQQLNEKNTENVQEHSATLKEKEFINQFKQVLSNRGLVYSEQDIINFHTSVKSSYLTIISGMSGTGKSKIVQAYAEALKLNSDFKIIPVSPAWTEDSDLIGYADTLNMIYRPSETELVDILKTASEKAHKESLFLICLDEMNLARVEHYFSQFLSILEADTDKRKLTLYNKELQNRIYNSAQYGYEIPIQDNVRFIGTVNIDESTHEFSNKVLDRANVITLDIEPFRKIAEASEKKSLKTLDTKEYKKDYITEFISRNPKINFDNETIEFLQALHNCLYKTNIHFGIGPRIFKQIDNYIKNIPVYTNSFDKKVGLDYQIKQRVLTKIRGSKEELDILLGNYNLENDETKNSKIIEILDKYIDISSFQESRKTIKEKAKEVNLNGYTF